MRKRNLLAVLGTIAAVCLSPVVAFAGGGGGGGGGGPCAGFANGSTLVMLDSCFDGVAHFISEQGTLTVRNDGQVPHSYTAVDGSFDTGLMDPGETAQISIAQAGLVPVYCTLHGTAEGHGMAGVLVVGEPPSRAISAAVLPGVSQQGSAGEHTHPAADPASQRQALDELQAGMTEMQDAIQTLSTRNRVNQFAPGLIGALGVALGGLALARTRGRPDPGEGLQ